MYQGGGVWTRSPLPLVCHCVVNQMNSSRSETLEHEVHEVVFSGGGYINISIQFLTKIKEKSLFYSICQ